MAGSTLIKEDDDEKIRQFDPASRDEFLTIELDTLKTLDFVIIAGDANQEWAAKDPVFRDEKKGCSLFQVDSAGIEYIASDDCKMSEKQREDQSAIKKFIEENGSENIYEYATFQIQLLNLQTANRCGIMRFSAGSKQVPGYSVGYGADIETKIQTEYLPRVQPEVSKTSKRVNDQEAVYPFQLEFIFS